MKVLISILFVVTAAYAELKCPAAQENDWSIELLLPHDNCNKFYKCTYGQPVEQQCFGDLYFNLETWQCDWPSNVDCGERIIPGEEEVEETPEIETEPDVKPQPEEEEAEEVEEEAVEEPVEEEEEAVEEEEEAVEEEEEAVEEEEEVVEEEEVAVEEEEEAAVEEEEVVEEEEEVVEEEEAAEEEEDAVEVEDAQPEIEFQENGCPVNPHVHWLLPHEEDCNAFYYCVWGEKVLRQCAESLHFNRELQVCDWPVAAGCTTSANKHYASRVAYRNLL